MNLFLCFNAKRNAKVHGNGMENEIEKITTNESIKASIDVNDARSMSEIKPRAHSSPLSNSKTFLFTSILVKSICVLGMSGCSVLLHTVRTYKQTEFDGFRRPSNKFRCHSHANVSFFPISHSTFAQINSPKLVE